jgi:uncharacterized phage protein (TIGR01671 family)
MSEIKFRAWYETLKTMVRVEAIHFINRELHGNTNEGRVYAVPFKESILMQYTGLKDKSGKEIYEGDILNPDPGSNHIICRVKMDIGYDSDGYKHQAWLGWMASMYSLLDIHEDSLIIGNIYENPELLPRLKVVEGE